MADKVKTKIVVIGGPTASGKTSLSVKIAKQFDGEIISADSMQIYKGLDIGTAKATPEEQQGIPHHLVDILSPEQRFSAADFVQRAQACIENISSRGKLPVIVGGTGLYIESLVKGVQFTKEEFNPALRRKLEEQAQREGALAMHAMLEKIDPEYAAKVHPNNGGRVLRAIELYMQTGTTMTQQLQNSLPAQQPYDTLLFALDCANRETLYQRINLRVDQMVQQGLEQEAMLVYQHRDTFATAAQAIGYKEFFGYFEHTQTLEQAVELLKQATRKYAKRQLTWFRRMQDIHWLQAEQDPFAQALPLLQQHLCRQASAQKENTI